MWKRNWTEWETNTNHVPSRYVVTKSGGIISKADSLRTQHLTDVRTALLQAAQVIKENPRHDGP